MKQALQLIRCVIALGCLTMAMAAARAETAVAVDLYKPFGSECYGFETGNYKRIDLVNRAVKRCVASGGDPRRVISAVTPEKGYGTLMFGQVRDRRGKVLSKHFVFYVSRSYAAAGVAAKADLRSIGCTDFYTARNLVAN